MRSKYHLKLWKDEKLKIDESGIDEQKLIVCELQRLIKFKY